MTPIDFCTSSATALLNVERGCGQSTAWNSENTFVHILPTGAPSASKRISICRQLLVAKSYRSHLITSTQSRLTMEPRPDLLKFSSTFMGQTLECAFVWIGCWRLFSGQV